MIHRPLSYSLFPYTTLFRSGLALLDVADAIRPYPEIIDYLKQVTEDDFLEEIVKLDRKSTRLNSSHVAISYAVFCLKKKNREVNRYSSVAISISERTLHIVS